jgi:hypothetical protein
MGWCKPRRIDKSSQIKKPPSGGFFIERFDVFSMCAQFQLFQLLRLGRQQQVFNHFANLIEKARFLIIAPFSNRLHTINGHRHGKK